MIRRIAMAVGDTAGHVLPAIAVAEAFAARFDDSEVHFFAAGAGTGHWLVEQAGFTLDRVTGSPIARVDRLAQMAALGRAAAGAVQARKLLARHRVRLVIGTGGYGSAGALVAARTLGLKTALIEPNVEPGLANRVLARIVHRAYVACPEAAAALPAVRSVVSGLPVRRAMAQSVAGRHRPEWPKLKLLVTSGSRGEQFLGICVPPFVLELKKAGMQVEVRHQGGTRAAEIQQHYERLGIEASTEPFIDDMGCALAWADFVVARAGAGTSAELALAGVPSLLVPLSDAANDHQAINAKAIAARGAALWIREEDWDTAVLAQRVIAIVRDGQAWQSMARAITALAMPDAADQIVRDCETLMEGHW